jgi:hypothetical protein
VKEAAKLQKAHEPSMINFNPQISIPDNRINEKNRLKKKIRKTPLNFGVRFGVKQEILNGYKSKGFFDK